MPTKIEWADETFNPWIGCTKVGPGCDHCYAEAMMDHRRHVVEWGRDGTAGTRQRTTPANWRKPVTWNNHAGININAWQGFKRANPGLTDEEMQAAGPIKPRRPRVFCASLADVFDTDVPPEWRADLFGLIAKTPYLDWLLVTKRIGNAARMLPWMTDPEKHGTDPCEPWSHVWLGITVVNQEEAQRDIKKLIGTPATKRFLSVEPLLGPINIAPWLERGDSGMDDDPLARSMLRQAERDGHAWIRPALDWVIVGGESGPKARPMHPDWVRSLRDQCAATKAPFFFKQWGEWMPVGRDPMEITRKEQDHGPTVTEYAWPDGETLIKTGKHRAGRTLDGRTHDEFPP
jgi:protein gp37